MKKALTGMLAAILLVSMFGCGNSAPAKSPAPASSKAPASSSEAPVSEASQAPAAAWSPDTEIEFVVPSSAGGGSDLNARTISDIAFSEKFSPKNFKVNNMPGGSGAVAFSYLAQKKDQDDIIMVLHNGQVMSALVNDSPVKAADLTYLPIVAFDNLTLCINAKDAKYKTVEELISAAKENPGKITIGGSQRGNTDHLCFEMMKKYLGIDISYVQFNSSGEVMTALLGGHVDFGIFNPSECIGQVEAKGVAPIATFADKRLEGAFADVPNFGELGYPDINVSEVRAIAGTPGMSQEAIAFYDEMIKKVTQTEKWQKEYIEKNYLTPIYMNSAEAKAFFDKECELYVSIFKEVGVIK